MDFKDYCKQLSERIATFKDSICTEEATKNTFIMPFIQMLGYDVFNPMEVVPELDCDLIRKKGEKIDYAIVKDGEPIMLVECKHWRQDLDLHNTQLQKYFVASKAKFGVLTNGIKYRFYTDLVKENIMDEVPFLEVNMEELKEAQIEELKKFHKSYFDVDNIISTAGKLKYMSELKREIRTEINAPTPELVRLFAKRVYDGVMTQKVLDQFTELVKQSFLNFVNDEISERLNVAIKSTAEPATTAPATPVVEDTAPAAESKIVTTEEEMQGFHIVKSILRNTIPAERVTCRDAQSYFAIFADDNNRRPICRLYFNQKKKRIGIFDAEKNETKYDLETLDSIFNVAEGLRKAVEPYL